MTHILHKARHESVGTRPLKKQNHALSARRESGLSRHSALEEAKPRTACTKHAASQWELNLGRSISRTLCTKPAASQWELSLGEKQNHARPTQPAPRVSENSVLEQAKSRTYYKNRAWELGLGGRKNTHVLHNPHRESVGTRPGKQQNHARPAQSTPRVSGDSALEEAKSRTVCTTRAASQWGLGLGGRKSRNACTNHATSRWEFNFGRSWITYHLHKACCESVGIRPWKKPNDAPPAQTTPRVSGNSALDEARMTHRLHEASHESVGTQSWKKQNHALSTQPKPHLMGARPWKKQDHAPSVKITPRISGNSALK
ncbi:hypothetical protein FIBSPDRAFT_890117 [Athelia psychrophila]|uniref:Uncharacterized protein n=1 Tax=Athelia psychrophila TaxID=1759441 RepID=A0A166LB01_9AGAM|nr:hypothetical protein FIBSPDRAFT_890117 [Fibularhizoctonia sp. CBS 109695]